MVQTEPLFMSKKEMVERNVADAYDANIWALHKVEGIPATRLGHKLHLSPEIVRKRASRIEKRIEAAPKTQTADYIWAQEMQRASSDLAVECIHHPHLVGEILALHDGLNTLRETKCC